MLQLLEQQTKLTKNQWLIAGAATLGDMLDFFDFLLIGFVLAFIVNDWQLTYGQSGAILLASGVSAPFGSLFYGWLADKLGRRTALISSVLNVSVATGAMALTPQGAWIYLLACRSFNIEQDRHQAELADVGLEPQDCGTASESRSLVHCR